MHIPFLPFFLAMLAIISATVLPVNLNEDSLHVAAHDDAFLFGFRGWANFSLLYEADRDLCETTATTIVFNQLTNTKFSPACQTFYDYMTSIPNSMLKSGSRGVSLIYVCSPSFLARPNPADLGVANIKFIINGPKAFPLPYLPVDITLTVINAEDNPVTNFTLPAVYEWGKVVQPNGKTMASLTGLHCK